MLKFLVAILFIQLCASKLTLTWTRISTKELNGIFVDPETSVGLIFKSTKDSLSLTNANGKALLEFSAVVEDSPLREDYSLSVLGSYYPANRTELTREDLEGYVESEARYLPDLYYAMSELGITGPDMPSAMGIYVVALGFYTHQSKFGKSAAPCKCDCPAAIDLSCGASTHGHPQCCDCLGQCGACGSCWNSVCGNCCWWKGCCGHDICCYAGSSSACLFPVNLKCDIIYTCTGFNTNCCGNPPRGKIDSCPVQSFGCECSRSVCCANSKWNCN